MPQGDGETVAVEESLKDCDNASERTWMRRKLCNQAVGCVRFSSLYISGAAFGGLRNCDVSHCFGKE
jgi:hypothetical protein